MAAKKKTLDVNIVGRTYKVACEDDEREALLAAVEYLDRKMADIKKSGKVASAERIAVMAALNITHELLSCRAEARSFDIDSLKRRITSMKATLDEALAAHTRLL